MTDKFVTYNEDRPTATGLPQAVDTKLNGRYATRSALDSAIIGTGGVVSPSVSRIIASLDPNTPLTEGDLLLVYAPPHESFRKFSTMYGLSPRWAGGQKWAIAADESADGGKTLRTTGDTAPERRLVSLDDAEGLRDVEVVARIKAEAHYPNVLGGGVAVRASGTVGSEYGYVVLMRQGGIQVAKYVNGTYSEVSRGAINIPPGEWYWMRVRIQGSSLMVSVWGDSEEEPTGWTLTATDTAISSGGWVGPTTTSNPSTMSWNVIGVAELETGDESAPVVAP